MRRSEGRRNAARSPRLLTADGPLETIGFVASGGEARTLQCAAHLRPAAETLFLEDVTVAKKKAAKKATKKPAKKGMKKK